MSKLFLLIFPSVFIALFCSQHRPSQDTSPVYNPENLINPEGKTIQERILTPDGYFRIKLEENSFGNYLRNLPLKPDGSDVYLYNGKRKRNQVHVAVIDMETGNRDLQQCADAVIRLRAEYLYKNKMYDQIHFNFTSGFKADYTKWAEGYRIKVTDNDASWVKTSNVPGDYEEFRKYLDIVFSYAGTLSLSKELVPAKYIDIQPGDVFIKGGSPGHAVIVVDVSVNNSTGKKIFLLVQSYMPAQDMHVLKNPSNNKLSPWYEVDLSSEIIITPEWEFYIYELKRFQ